MSAELPKMPPIDQSRMLPYSAIRYVPGYPEEYVKEYARAFAQEAARQAMERCIAAIAACRPAEPNDVWEGAFQHVCDENIAAIRALIPQDPDHLAGVGNMVDGKDQSEKRHG